jgi:hypothetical protein
LYVERPKRELFRLRLEPVNDLATGRLPDTLVGTDVAKYFVNVPDAPRPASEYNSPVFGVIL